MNEMDEAADAILKAAGHDGSLEDLSDVEDGSSSLSEIEDKDVDVEEDAEASDAENSSEAETERLEQSPNKFRPQQDVLLTAHSQTYERSKLNKQVTEEEDEQDEQDDEDDEESLSDDDEISVNETPQSPKSPEELEPQALTTATSLQDSSGEGKKTLSIMDPDTKKRKRSIMGGAVFDEDLEEPLRKRTGSVLTPVDDYAIEDEINHEEEVDVSNPISGDVSGDEAEPAHTEEVGGEDVEDAVAVDEIAPELPNILLSPKKRGRKKKKGVENGIENHEETEIAHAGDAVLNGDLEVRNGDEDQADNEGDDEAAALKNEEERELISCSLFGS